MIRVAAIHLERNSPDADLDNCLRQLELAVTTHAPAIVVCPELTLPAGEEGDESALGRARARFAECAVRHRVFIALSLSCQQTRLQTWLTPEPQATDDVPAESLLTVESPYGRLGLCAGLSLFDSEAVRRVASAGLSLIAAPLSLCRAPKTALHVPARASENQLVVAVATLFERRPAAEPDVELEQPSASARGSVSQVVGANGRTLSIAAIDEAGVAVAELELPSAELAITPERRPELYRSAGGRGRRRFSASPRSLTVAIADLREADLTEDGAAVAALTAHAAAEIAALASAGTGLIVLPALLGADVTSREHAEPWADRFQAIVRELAEALTKSGSHVVTSLVERVEGDLTHVGLVIGAAGVIARQRQLHVRSDAWLRAGRRVESIPLPWGNLALAVGTDALVPELLASQRAAGADLIAAVLTEAERRATLYSLPALADELGIPIVAALRAPSDIEHAGASLIVDPRAWPARRAREEEARLVAEITIRAADEPASRVLVEFAAI